MQRAKLFIKLIINPVAAARVLQFLETGYEINGNIYEKHSCFNIEFRSNV